MSNSFLCIILFALENYMNMKNLERKHMNSQRDLEKANDQ